MRIGKEARRVLQGRSDHGSDTVQVGLRLPRRDLELIDALAAKIGMNRSRFILNALRAHLKHQHGLSLSSLNDHDEA